MGKITDLPASISDAGQNKNYTMPSTASVVLVRSNATPQNRPRNSTVADNYISQEISAGRAYTANIMNWNPRDSVVLPVLLDDASEYSYARITLDGKKWYAFITGSYTNRTSTIFDIYIDVLATYNATLGHSHVVRGHVGVAASQGDTYGDQYCLEPEPIFVPSIENEYSSTSLTLLDPNTSSVAVIATSNLNNYALKTHFNNTSGIKGFSWNSHPSLEEIPRQEGTPWPDFPLINRPPSGSFFLPNPVVDVGVPDTDNILGMNIPFAEPDPLGSENFPFRYQVPIVSNVEPSTIDGVVQAGALYLFETIAVYKGWLATMRFFPWVTDTIKSAWLVPPGHYGVTGGTTVLTNRNFYDKTAMLAASMVPVRIANATTSVNNNLSIANWRNNLLSSKGAGIYRKIITSQFASIQLSDRNSKVEVWPELQNNSAATATISRAILPSGGVYRARFTNTNLADERERAVVGEISTQISVQADGMMANLAGSANQFIISAFLSRMDSYNAYFHNTYNRYAQTQNNVGQANVTYSQNILSMLTGGLLGR